MTEELELLASPEWCSEAIAWEKSRAEACRRQRRPIMASDVQDAFMAGAVAAVAAERERCAAIVLAALPTEERSVNWTEENHVLDDVLRNLADDISKG